MEFKSVELDGLDSLRSAGRRMMSEFAFWSREVNTNARKFSGDK